MHGATPTEQGNSKGVGSTDPHTDSIKSERGIERVSLTEWQHSEGASDTMTHTNPIKSEGNGAHASTSTSFEGENVLPSALPVASRERVAQAAAKKFSQGPVTNTHSQLRNVLEGVLHAATFLESKVINTPSALPVKSIRHIGNLPITRIQISAGPGTQQRPMRLAVYFRARERESRIQPTPVTSSKRSKYQQTGSEMSHTESLDAQSVAKRPKNIEHN